MRTCSLCRVPKPLTEFYRRTRSRDGYQAHCSACTRQALDAADARQKAARAAGARVPRRRRSATRSTYSYGRTYTPPTPAWAPTCTPPPPSAPPDVVLEYEDLERLIAARAEEVVDLLMDVTDDDHPLGGTPLLLEALAERLPHTCPEDDEDYEGDPCLLHLLADMHTDRLRQRFPGAARAIEHCLDVIYPGRLSAEAGAGDTNSGE